MEYPAEGSERDLPYPARREVFRMEAEAIGGPEEKRVSGEPLPLHGARWRWNRMVPSGYRPHFKPSKVFAPYLNYQRPGQPVKTARSWGRMLDQMKRNDMTMEEFVEELSPEELARGKIRDRNGGFSGRPPSWVPHEFHRACIRELMRRGKQLWQENYIAAIEALTEVANNPDVDVKDRLKAAMYVVERIEGKVPERLQITHEEPWQIIIREIVAEVPEEAIRRAQNSLEGIVDAEVVEELLDEEEPEEEESEPPPPRPRRDARRRRRR